MLNKDVIDKEILELEKHDTTYATCERLAWLYIIRDHMQEPVVTEKTKSAVGVSGESDFMKAVSGKATDLVICVLDEFMETLKIVNPRLYDGVMRKLNE